MSSPALSSPHGRNLRTRRSLLISLGVIAGGLALIGADDATARRVRRRGTRKNRNKKSETSISTPGQPGQPGTPGTIPE
jgi:nucleoid-associated protein YgaU